MVKFRVELKIMDINILVVIILLVLQYYSERTREVC